MNPMVAVRLFTATVLFLLLANVNIWATTGTHLVLAVGYRALLLLAPLFMYFGINKGLRVSLLIGSISTFSLFYSINGINIFFFALSMAVSGYICKYVNSQTAKGAADNKVSLNVGSLISGGLILLSDNKDILLICCSILMGASLYYSLKLDIKCELPKAPSKGKLVFKWKWLPLVRWSLIGIATGIKLTGIFAILPQFLLQKTGMLPPWYGSLVMINSFGVIFFQHKIIYWLEKVKGPWTGLAAMSAMVLLAVPQLLRVELFTFAIMWISLLTFGECALSRYDKIASSEGYLLPKEVLVGLGSFLTVYLSREHGDYIYLSGLIGLSCMLMAFSIQYFELKIANRLQPSQPFVKSGVLRLEALKAIDPEY